MSKLLPQLKEHIKKFQRQIDALRLEIKELESLKDIKKPCMRCGRESTHFCDGEFCDAHDPGAQWCSSCNKGRTIGDTIYGDSRCYTYM